MNITRQERLFYNLPLFCRKSRDDFDRRPIDSLGIEVGGGWFELLDHLSASVEQAVADLAAGGVSLQDCPCAAQIKQKFGGLRVHIDGRSRLPKCIDMEIADTERTADETCEACGSQGSLRKVAWIHVACERCEQTNLNTSSDMRSSDADFEQHFKVLERLLGNRGGE